MEEAKRCVRKALECFKRGEKLVSVVSEWKKLVIDVYEDIVEIETDLKEFVILNWKKN